MMKIGTVKERTSFENRVGIIPSHAYEYIQAGHAVFVEKGSGVGSGFLDSDYEEVGARLVDVETVWETCDMVIKVKEPQVSEYPYMRENQIVFCYFHLASHPDLAEVLMEKKVSAVAYETITNSYGHLPLLKPMSEIAGRLAVQQGAKYLEKTYGGKGTLLSGVAGVRGGNVVIIGSGVVGMNACKAALGLGANVTVMSQDLSRLDYLSDVFGGQIQTVYSDTKNIEKELKTADLVIGSVNVPGARTPKLIMRDHLKMMQPGSVIVDVSIDQGGFAETSRPTTHDNPIYIEEGIVHYCVGNMPGAVPMTATQALGNATLPYGLALANHGLKQSFEKDPGLLNGLNVYNGHITHPQVASALEKVCKPYENEDK